MRMILKTNIFPCSASWDGDYFESTLSIKSSITFPRCWSYSWRSSQEWSTCWKDSYADSTSWSGNTF